MMKYLIVGNSAAGLFALEEIRRRDRLGTITVLTAEKEPSYSRCLTTYYLAGDIPVSQLYLRSADLAEKLKVRVVYGVKVDGLDSVGHSVSAQGAEWPYNRLLLATGASAVKSDVPGSGLPEVFTLRTLQDALAINRTIAQGARKAVVIGAGLVGLKTGYALRKRGLEVTVMASSAQILSQMLSPAAAGLIQTHLEEHGLQFLLQTDAVSINGSGRVQSVTLAGRNGRHPLNSSLREIEADLVVIGKGVQPNLAEWRESGLHLGHGIRVDARLATSLPDVYAAGDVVESWDRVRHKFTVNATWPNATVQGRLAGANMCGFEVKYPGSFPLNSVDFFGLSAMAAGITRLPPKPVQAEGSTRAEEPLSQSKGDWTQEERFKLLSGRPTYQSLIWQDDVLKGFVLLGDTAQAGVLTNLVKEGRPLSPNLRRLASERRGGLAGGLFYSG